MSTYKLGEHFAGLGHTVGVFSFESDGHIKQNFARLFSARAAGGVGNARNLCQLEQTVRQFQPAVVINQMPYEHAIGGILRSLEPPLLIGCLRNTLFSVKNNLDRYGPRVLPKSLVPLFRNLVGRRLLLYGHRSRHRHDLERILATYDQFVMFAPPNLEELRYFVPDFDPRKISLIPNSIPRVMDRVPEKGKRLLWLGRLDYEQKRADLILPLWTRIQRALPDWELDVVGDGPALADLHQVITAEGIEGVRLHGRQKPDDFFTQSPIFLMTSAFEGFPNTLVEAQSYGAVPVLFNSFPVAEWLVADSVNGLLIPPFDVGAMAERVVEVATADNRIELMNAALVNARRFHIKTVGQRWQQLFDAGLNRHRYMLSPCEDFKGGT